jgi:hypothetical protein
METALNLSGQPVRRGTIAHDHEVYMLLADAAAHLRDGEALARYAPLAEELAERDGHRLYLAIAQRARGVAAQLKGAHGEAAESLNGALEGFQALDAGWQTGRTLSELGELALARSDAQAARGYFTQALAEFEARRAAPDAARTRESLARLAG